MRVLVATVQVPFVRGGAEVLAEGLVGALRAAGHQAEIAAIPFKWYPPERLVEQALACRLLDLTESAGVPIDRLIALKFPAYLVRHPRKVLWLIHQHRSAYELWDTHLGDLDGYPRGRQVRDAIHEADRAFLPEAEIRYTISRTVSARLSRFSGLEAEPLYHPPADPHLFRSEPAEDYLFFPSRLAPEKRQALVLEALARTEAPVRLVFAGVGASPAYEERLKASARELKVEDRVSWLGRVSEEDKRRLYARARAVVFPPLDEDYGYITLEAMLSARPVITCTDSCGPLEFVAEGETGLIAEPTPAALARALDRLWRDRDGGRAMGEAGRARYDRMGISWDNVLARLLR